MPTSALKYLQMCWYVPVQMHYSSELDTSLTALDALQQGSERMNSQASCYSVSSRATDIIFSKWKNRVKTFSVRGEGQSAKSIERMLGQSNETVRTHTHNDHEKL